MIYWQLHYIIKRDQEAALQTQCSVLDFYNYVLTTRTDGLMDLLVYSNDDQEIERLAKLFDQADYNFVDRTQYDEMEMLAQFNPQSPIRLADALVLYPCDPPAQSDDMIVHVPAGPAFGDGRHPTTQMLARYIMSMDCQDKTFLDLGCGTGVLGVVAKLRGAASVDFTDVDPDSVRFTEEVCALNGYPEACVWESNLLEDCTKSYDVVIANIYADLLLDVLTDPQLTTVLPQGLLLLSGISFKRIEEVLEAAAQAGFTIVHQEEQAWWHCVILERAA